MILVHRQRYQVLRLILLWLALWFSSGTLKLLADAPPISELSGRTPVIIDTDIGDDTDDSWALVFALKNPELDVKLVTTTCGKQLYRGALIAKFLMTANRTDIPIGLGLGPDDGKRRMQNWLGDFTLSQYPGTFDKDGVQALIDAVNSASTPITIIAIGPLNTIGAALRKDPAIAQRANLVAMAGSIRTGYGGVPGAAVEYNVWRDIEDAKQVFAAPWHRMTITPLDTGAGVSIVGARYESLLAKGDPVVHALLTNSALAHGASDPAKINFGGSGFDLVGAFLAENKPSRFARIETLKITVTPQGKTIIDSSGKEMGVATSWDDLNAFEDHVVDVLLKPVTSKSVP